MDSQDFYNQESEQYSQKRYGGQVDSYVKYFFNQRLNLVLTMLHRISKGRSDMSLLEVGCADGVVLRQTKRTLSEKFTRLVGVDIAENMIARARILSVGMGIEFFSKNQTLNEKFHTILLVGFMTGPLIELERAYVNEHLKDGGYAIISLAGRHSLQARLKLQDKPYLADYRTYREYRELLEKNFEIINTQYYGLVIPKLWRFPKLARFLQPALDSIGTFLFPELMHEVLYLLRKK